MPDEIERTIYKLELDGSSYINGVEKLSASTAKLTTEQEKANRALQINKEALNDSASTLAKAKKTLEDYTGTNQKYRGQLEKNVSDEVANQQRITKFLAVNQKAYEDASKAAANFAAVAARAGNLQPAQGQGKIAAPISAPSAITNQLAAAVNVSDFIATQEIIEKTKLEFDGLAQSVQIAENRMAQLNDTDEEFKTLAPIVEQGKEALKQYDIATNGAVESSSSLRAQIRQGKEELVKLEQAGKGATKQYFDLEKQVAKLTDEFGDQQARIKTLASDTKLLDFGKGAITAATSAFQLYTSVSILVGDENKELQKKTQQLFAAMQLLQGLEQLSNLTRREGVLATLAQSGAQTIYTTVVGASTGALKAFRLALLATGIGAAIVLIGFLVSKWNDLQEAEKKAGEQQKALLDISKKAVDVYADEVIHLKLLSSEYENSATSLKRKKEIQDELQKSYPSYFKDLDTQADKEKYIAEQVDKVSQALILQAKIQGAQALLAEKFKTLLKEQFDPSEAVDTYDAIGAGLKNMFGTIGEAGEELGKTAEKNIKKGEAEYDKFSKFITDFVNKSNKELEALGGDPKKQGEKTKTERAKKELQDDYEARKAALLEQLAKLAEVEFQSEITIRKQHDARLKKALIDIDKDKGLKPEERKDLVNLTAKVNTTELNKALAEFAKKQTDARAKLNDELLALQDKNTLDQINFLQNEFDRRAKLIEFNQAKEVVDAIFANRKRQEELEASSLLLYGEDYKNNQNYLNRKAILTAAGEQVITDITLKAVNERKDLAADIFKSLLDSYQQAISGADLIFTEDEAAAIKALSAKFLAGKISYERYQKELAKIQKAANKDRLQGTLAVEKDELAALDRKLAAETDKYSKYYKDLKKQRDDLAKKIATDEITDAEVDDPNKQKRDSITDYANAIGAVADSIIQFWQKANAAESAALERSISLQEKRVSAAQRIADRGNAQYLKAEEDRLTELNLKRENAARKQLGIDAALQASQILVGITGAIAKIATPGIGIAETIGAIAIIIGSLATGYSLVKSLQGNQPKLATGTKLLERNGNPSGIDTIPAWLNEGEAVIPTHRNKAYHPTVAAIYDGTIPAEHLNNFVRQYHQVKGVPQVDYSRIKNAAEMHIGENGRMAVLLSDQNRKLDENNDLQRQTLRAMKSMAVSANIDKDGVAIMVNEYIAQMKINARV